MPNIDKEKNKFIDCNNAIVNYKDGDVVIFDHVEGLSMSFPLKPKTTLLAFCCKGQIMLTINGKTLEFFPGDVLICPPNVKIEKSQRSKDLDGQAIALSDHIIQALLRDKMEIWNHVVYIDQFYKLTLSEECKHELDLYYMLLSSKLKDKSQTLSYLTLESLLRALLLDLCNILGEIKGRQIDNQKISQGKMLFNRFLSLISNSEVKRQPIATYAAELAISPKYLTMLCLKYSNKTASDWVVQYTMEDIRFYLKNSNLSIKEISARMGFSNMSHFGSYVRKYMGMSPSQFRHRK